MDLSLVIGRWCCFFEWLWSLAARGEGIKSGTCSAREFEWRSYGISFSAVHTDSGQTVCRVRAY